MSLTFAPRLASAMTSSASVDALLPLSFLEAVRTVDSPIEQLEPEIELVGELRNKRLGLSETVYNQISGTAKPCARISERRTMRPHARQIDRSTAGSEAVFRQRVVTRGRSLCTLSAVQRHFCDAPNLFKKSLTTRYTRRLADRYFNGQVTRAGSSIYLEVNESVTVDSAPRRSGCAYYEGGCTSCCASS